MVVVFYVSGHGFGHASRSIEVMNALARRQPGVRLIVRSAVPRWFFETNLTTPADVHTLDTDTGVVQIDSLELDEGATAVRAADFYSTFGLRVDREAAELREVGATVVVADVPPLGCAAAARLGIPSIAVGNFTWDWIYAEYRAFDLLAPPVVPIVADAYRLATSALRLPFHGGFESMQQVLEDIPLIARHSEAGRENARRLLGFDRDEQVVLSSFGRYSTELPYGEVARTAPFTIAITDLEESTDSGSVPGIRRIALKELGERGLRYPDLVAAADLVISKPGYGIVSECIAAGTPLLYTSRGRFAEHDVFVREMPRYLRCRHISLEDLRAGRWADAVAALLRQAAPPEPLATDGADVAAARIVEIGSGRRRR